MHCHHFQQSSKSGAYRLFEQLLVLQPKGQSESRQAGGNRKMLRQELCKLTRQSVQ